MSKTGKRKQPITLATIGGMLKSAAIINEHFNTRLEQESIVVGTILRTPTGKEREALQLSDRASALGIDLTEGYSGNYSIGMYQSCQVLVGLAAELALKFAYEQDNPSMDPPGGHDLFVLYGKLSQDRKADIESDYSIRILRRQDMQPVNWQTAESVFKAVRNHFVDWRYMSERRVIPYFQPVLLVEAACSVCKTLGMNIGFEK